MRCLVKRLVPALALLTILTGAAQAADGFYVGAKLGAAFMSADDPEITQGQTTTTMDDTDDDNTSFGLGLGVGYDFDQGFGVPVRLELEYLFRGSFDYSRAIGAFGMVDVETNVHTFFVNSMLDWHTGTNFIPYLQGGVGLARHSNEADNAVIFPAGSEDDNSTGFAWNVGAGLGYMITESWTADFGYRYASYGTVEIDDDAGNELEYDLNGHELLFGLRYGF